MFEEMIESIKLDTVKYLYHVRVQVEAPKREKVAEEAEAIHGEKEVNNK